MLRPGKIRKIRLLKDGLVLKNLLLCNVNAQRLKAVDDVTARIGRGVFKRIDENRELLEQLQSSCPEFLESHPWVQNWLSSQDDFLTELAKAAQAVNPHESQNQIESGWVFPRPWPSMTISAGTRKTAIPQQHEAKTDQTWVDHAYPLQQVTIKLQGTKHSTIENITGQLETVLARIKSGTTTGEDHDDDFGYSFTLEQCPLGPSFFTGAFGRK